MPDDRLARAARQHDHAVAGRARTRATAAIWYGYGVNTSRRVADRERRAVDETGDVIDRIADPEQRALDRAAIERSARRTGRRAA